MWTCALFQSQPTTSRTRCRTLAQPRALRHRTDNATPAPTHTRRRTSILRCSQPDMWDRPTRLLVVKGSESLPTPPPIGGADHSTEPPRSFYPQRSTVPQARGNSKAGQAAGEARHLSFANRGCAVARRCAGSGAALRGSGLRGSRAGPLASDGWPAASSWDSIVPLLLGTT